MKKIIICFITLLAVSAHAHGQIINNGETCEDTPYYKEVRKYLKENPKPTAAKLLLSRFYRNGSDLVCKFTFSIPVDEAECEGGRRTISWSIINWKKVIVDDVYWPLCDY